MNLDGLSIIELKQLLARVNHDLKLNKPTIKRIKKDNAPVLSEGAICNNIASRFTNKLYNAPVQNAKIIADIAIQRDILDYLHNGGHIITTKSNRINSKAVRGAKAGIKLYRKFAV
jgi:hypothetical protein